MTTLSKNKIKYIKKLRLKKYRDTEGLFIVEKLKTIVPYLENGFELVELYSTEDFDHPQVENHKVLTISHKELKQISNLKNPHDALAVFKKPTIKELELKGMLLGLESIQDPGNLGTIIRTAEWFGIKQIVCSEDTADIYNPKTIQAAMGSLAHMQVYYTSLEKWLKNARLPVVITDMQGKNVFDFNFPDDFILILGNEGHGVSHSIRNLAREAISIPGHPSHQTESLNVSVAGAIVMAEWFNQRK